VPADIEFAFREGKLFLLQIRPFVESGAARESLYLTTLDNGLRTRRFATVSLAEVPAEPEVGVSAGKEAK
jgi:hypothetical protein